MDKGEIVAIDGTTLRRSFDRAASTSPLHLVSAWACKDRLVLDQLKTVDHSNEITAIPSLLRLLDLAGCVVTVDARGTQKQLASDITTAHSAQLVQTRNLPAGWHQGPTSSGSL